MKPDKLLQGLSLGLVFGMVLQKAGVTDYQVMLDTLLLRELTVVKVMLTAVVVGSIGIYALRSAGIIELEVRPAGFGRNVIGGLVFGVGMALLGWCPGTAVGAVGEGRLDALVGLAGMIAGGMLFAHLYPRVKQVYTLGHLGERTWWELLAINPWLFIIPLNAALAALMWWFEQVGL